MGGGAGAGPQPRVVSMLLHCPQRAQCVCVWHPLVMGMFTIISHQEGSKREADKNTVPFKKATLSSSCLFSGDSEPREKRHNMG